MRQDGKLVRNGQAVSVTAQRRVPTRTCVGCGVRAAKSDLLRLVAVGDEIVPDVTARLPGRGAYLHPSHRCLAQAQRRRVISRALRVPGVSSTARLAEYLEALSPEHT
jgi:predicted RNA-binding protein YlxR (DUF448 family)